MARVNHILSRSTGWFHRALGRWWGSVGCRVAFFMSAALFLAAVLVGSFYYRQQKKILDDEIRQGALYEAREITALATDDIAAGNTGALQKKLWSRISSRGESSSGNDLLYVVVYGKGGAFLAGSSASEPYRKGGSFVYTMPSGKRKDLPDAIFVPELRQVQPLSFLVQSPGIYDLTQAIFKGPARIGYVRIGISGQRRAEKYTAVTQQAAIALLGLIVVGLGFSKIITVGITRPILRLSEAAEKLSQQAWDSPLPVKGKDEISRLGHAFNQMAIALKQRELSLSRGNKDLFILHTSGLDLMESLDLDELLVKIAARAEDLIRADTTSLAVVDDSVGLRYLGAYGSKAGNLQALPAPLESGGIYNWLASYGTPLLITDAQSDFRLDSGLMKSMDVKCLMTVPLWTSNTMTGLLTVVNKKGGTGFNKHDLRLFTVFSNLAGAALQNASLYTDLREKMSELSRTQEQLVHSTKMAAIGELAANVAHEVNNPLTSVLGYTTHLLKTPDMPDSPKRILGMMEQETLRVRKIIRKLLDFSRLKTTQMQSTDVLLPLRETAAFVQGAAEASGVKIHEEYDDSPVVANIDANEMKQVFINIMNNALQAMPRGGELRIRLVTTDDREVAIEFADTGVGIIPENKKRIFDPFFSTKELGDGTGLGLSISYRIIQNHGGRIEVESEVGKGTTFRVFLPICKNAVLTHG